jgi:hypothetical protein
MSIIEDKPTIKHLDTRIFLIGLFDLSLQERIWVKNLAFSILRDLSPMFFFSFFFNFFISKKLATFPKTLANLVHITLQNYFPK